MKRKISDYFIPQKRPPRPPKPPAPPLYPSPRQKRQFLKNEVEQHTIPDLAAIVLDYARDEPLVITEKKPEPLPSFDLQTEIWGQSLWTLVIDFDHIFISLETRTMFGNQPVTEEELDSEEKATRVRRILQKDCFETEEFRISFHGSNRIKVCCKKDYDPDFGCLRIDLGYRLGPAFLQHLKDLSS